MPRIVSGRWGGRRIVVPKDERVRPTTERVREALLAILAPELASARVVDLFAGSGALGLEALSRGARHATFVELHPPSLAAIKANIESLGAEDETVVRRGDAMRIAATFRRGEFDLALADPPFTVDFAPRLAKLWQDHPFASLLAVEHPPTVTIPGADTRRWGDIAFSFLRAT